MQDLKVVSTDPSTGSRIYSASHMLYTQPSNGMLGCGPGADPAIVSPVPFVPQQQGFSSVVFLYAPNGSGPLGTTVNQIFENAVTTTSRPGFAGMTRTTAPDYYVSRSPASSTINPGGTATFTLTATPFPTSRYNGPVTWSMSDLSAFGITSVTFSPNPITVVDGQPEASTTMTVLTSPNIQPNNTYAFRPLSTGNGGQRHSITTDLVVQAASCPRGQIAGCCPGDPCRPSGTNCLGVICPNGVVSSGDN